MFGSVSARPRSEVLEILSGVEMRCPLSHGESLGSTQEKTAPPPERGTRFFSGCRKSGDYLIDLTALSAETTPETMAQEFIIAVKLSAPLAPPTTQPAP